MIFLDPRECFFYQLDFMIIDIYGNKKTYFRNRNIKFLTSIHILF